MPRRALSDLNGRQKVAVLLIALGQQLSVEVLKHLSEEEIESITLEIANFQKIEPELQEEVLEEFYNMLLAQRYISLGGVGYARDVLERALGSGKADEIISKLSSFIKVSPFDFLKRTDPQQLLAFIQNEHPQTIALILSYLPPESASQILSGLPPEIQVEVARRIATMDRTSPDVVREVERVMEKKLSTLLETEFSQVGGIQALVEVLNRVDRGTERLILESLEDQDPELAEEVKKRMFVFEDIRLLDDRSIQLVLREIDMKDLALALKAVSDDVKNRIFKNMSQRAAQTLQEDMEYMGPVRLKDVEDAQQRIVATIRRLEEEGQIIIARGGEVEFV